MRKGQVAMARELFHRGSEHRSGRRMWERVIQTGQEAKEAILKEPLTTEAGPGQTGPWRRGRRQGTRTETRPIEG